MDGGGFKARQGSLQKTEKGMEGPLGEQGENGKVWTELSVPSQPAGGRKGVCPKWKGGG